MSGGDVVTDHVFQNPLGVEPGNFGQDAGPWSRGDGYKTADEPSIDNRVEVKCFFGLIVGHELRAG